MQLLNNNAHSAQLLISLDELYILHQSLNEVCHGIDLFEFETRMGASRKEVEGLMKSIRIIIEKLERTEGIAE